MPKVNVYLPDDLSERVKAAGIPVSAVCQRALEDALRTASAVTATVELSGVVTKQLARDMSRFTNRARQVVALARQEAARRKHDYVGTEHLLLGILDEGGNLALQVIDTLNIDRGAIRAGVEELMGPDGSAPAEEAADLTPNAKQVFVAALTESLKLGHNYIGCEHLLLGLAQESDGIAGRILRALGADVTAVRRVTVQALAGYKKPQTQMDEILRRLEALEARLKE